MNKTPIDLLIEKGYEDVIVFRNPDYTTALIGLTLQGNAVYDSDLMLEWLIEQEEMTAEEAEDFICYNDSFYYGEGHPIVYYGDEYEELMMEEDPEYKPVVFIKLDDLPDKTTNKLIKNIN